MSSSGDRTDQEVRCFGMCTNEAIALKCVNVAVVVFERALVVDSSIG
jgi:hypothetical protein